MRAIFFLLPAAITGLSLLLARLIGSVVHGPASWSPDLVATLIMGLRFDLKLLAGLWLLPWLAAQIISQSMPASLPSVKAWLRRFFFAQLLLINALAVANFLYQGYFGTPFSPAVFGLFDDSTQVVLLTIWHDLPVVRALLVIALATWLQWRLWIYLEARLATRVAAAPSRRRATFATVLTVGLLVFLARGRLDAQPINHEDFQVSPNITLSNLVPNAPVALWYAWDDYRSATQLTDDPLVGLKAAGFSSPQAAAAKLGMATRDDADIIGALVRTTPKNPAAKAKPPHVVVVLFESWGAQVLRRHAPDNDLLGRMAKHVRQDFWFPRFTSSRRATHPSTEALLINSPITPLSQGRHGEINYLSAAARPFKEAGYRTIFMYGASARWRALHRAMPHFGFDEVLDLADIKQRFPQASEDDNGAHDEFLYRLAEERLQVLDAQGVPAMLFILNVTNHPPYSRQMLPPGYTGPEANLKRFADAVLPPEKTAIALQGFRYASDQLGAFIDTLAASPHGERTLVAATGDHYVRNFVRCDGDADAAWKDLVGFYLRVPPAYREGAEFAPGEFGGHRDIFPTLYRRALSEARYLAFGEDLLAPGRSKHGGIAVGDLSNVYRGDEVALKMNSPTFFRFDPSKEKLVPAAPSRAMLAAVERERALAALQDWTIRLQATGRLKEWPAS